MCLENTKWFNSLNQPINKSVIQKCGSKHGLAWLYLIIECVEYLSLLTKTLHGQERGQKVRLLQPSLGSELTSCLPVLKQALISSPAYF